MRDDQPLSTAHQDQRGVDPATRLVRSLDGEYYLLREAAERVGISKHTLRRYLADGREDMKPSKSVHMGRTEVYLYTSSDLERMRKVLDSQRAVVEFQGSNGRPTQYSLSERKHRQRLFSRRYYYQRQKEKHELNEHWDRAKSAQESIIKINRELEEMGSERQR